MPVLATYGDAQNVYDDDRRSCTRRRTPSYCSLLCQPPAPRIRQLCRSAPMAVGLTGGITPRVCTRESFSRVLVVFSTIRRPESGRTLMYCAPNLHADLRMPYCTTAIANDAVSSNVITSMPAVAAAAAELHSRRPSVSLTPPVRHR